MDKENNHFKDQEGNTLIFVSKENKFHYNEISEAIEAVKGICPNNDQSQILSSKSTMGYTSPL